VLYNNELNLILFGVDLNLDLAVQGRLPDFSDRRHDREPEVDAVSHTKGTGDRCFLLHFLRILSVHSFDKIRILWAFSDGDHRPAATALPNQLNLFNT
jgi:hypothetical protein